MESEKAGHSREGGLLLPVYTVNEMADGFAASVTAVLTMAVTGRLSDAHAEGFTQLNTTLPIGDPGDRPYRGNRHRRLGP
jgi:hypothetical protein